MSSNDFLKMPNWYPALASFALKTSFVKLPPAAVKALADGVGNGEKCDMESEISRQVINELALVMDNITGNSFVNVDLCAPTDTERFAEKRGAVYSANSAWFYLTRSEKVARSAAAGEVEYICVRPFRRVNSAREFRLFIKDGALAAASQYNLDRHYRRLEGVRDKYWQLLLDFVNSNIWKLPVKTLVMDVYITSKDEILVFDLNPWGEPTAPLLLRSWERDWQEQGGLVLMDPPTAISGDVKVSF